MTPREDGLSLYKSGLYQDALDAFLSEDIDPVEDPELSYLMGLCYTRLNEYNAAIFYLEKSLEYDPSFIRVYQTRMVLSYIYNLTGNYSGSENQLRKIIDDGFESSQVFTSLGFSLWNQGKIQDSLDFLTRSLELDPENPNTLNSLGYIMAEEGINPEKAEEYCRKAVSLNPINPNYLDSLAWALFRIGKYGEAREYLKRALDEDDDPVFRDHLSTVNRYDKI